MAVMARATAAEAKRNPRAHAFLPKVGYLQVGELTNQGSFPTGNCNPPVPVQDGSWHSLNPPGGGPPVTFQWVSLSWVRLDNRSQRLGYAPGYLSSHGWAYGGPATGLHG